MLDRAIRREVQHTGGIHETVHFRLMPAAINTAGAIEAEVARIARNVGSASLMSLFGGAVVAGIAVATLARRRRGYRSSFGR